ncbi:unnamed protein product [Amoebophrya sp. A25]|nr:unnamed protein product [Amoebophrya sp. A25]|eukprot:GSA25T00004581001.1
MSRNMMEQEDQHKAPLQQHLLFCTDICLAAPDAVVSVWLAQQVPVE